MWRHAEKGCSAQQEVFDWREQPNMAAHNLTWNLWVNPTATNRPNGRCDWWVELYLQKTFWRRMRHTLREYVADLWPMACLVFTKSQNSRRHVVQLRNPMSLTSFIQAESLERSLLATLATTNLAHFVASVWVTKLIDVGFRRSWFVLEETGPALNNHMYTVLRRVFFFLAQVIYSYICISSIFFNLHGITKYNNIYLFVFGVHIDTSLTPSSAQKY